MSLTYRLYLLIGQTYGHSDRKQTAEKLAQIILLHKPYIVIAKVMSLIYRLYLLIGQTYGHSDSKQTAEKLARDYLTS